jgi:glutathione S-transferase
VSQSDEEIVFYTNPMSRGRIARWMLEEIGQPYRTVVLDYGTTMKAADYLAINPMGKVPAVTHRGVTVTECAAVCTYLADAFPAAGLFAWVDFMFTYTIDVTKKPAKAVQLASNFVASPRRVGLPHGF